MFTILLVSTTLLQAPGASAPATRDGAEAALSEIAGFVAQPILWNGEEVGLDWRLESFREGRLHVSGSAGAMSVFSRLLQVLEGDPRFSDVAMGEVARESWGYRFEASARFTPGEGRWPAMVTTRTLLEVAAGLGAEVESVELPRRWQQDPDQVTVTLVLGEAGGEVQWRRALEGAKPPLACRLAPPDEGQVERAGRKRFVVRQPGLAR